MIIELSSPSKHTQTHLAVKDKEIVRKGLHSVAEK